MELRSRIIQLRDVIHAAATADGARDVLVFGSVAREGPPPSD
jgi:predicted nucleotidyltransferase